jgi:hypothetical protein
MGVDDVEEEVVVVVMNGATRMRRDHFHKSTSPPRAD